MASIHVAEVWRRVMGKKTRLLLLVIADNCGGDGHDCFEMDARYFAQKSGIELARAERIIDRLRRKKVIVNFRMNRGSSIYDLDLSALPVREGF